MTPTPSNFIAWLREGARAAFLRTPRWHGLRATPQALLLLLLAALGVDIIVYRLHMQGAANFNWHALLSGWFPTVVTLLACWWVAPRQGIPGEPAQAPAASALFLMCVSLGLLISMLAPVVALALGSALALPTAAAYVGPYLAWTVGMAWLGGASIVLLMRSGHGPPLMRAMAATALVVATPAPWGDRAQLWYSASLESDADAIAARFTWTPALLEAQALTLPQRIATLAPQRPGVVDLYALTYAPYADEDVFLRESKMVAGVMEQRFGAQGRSLMLVNHRSTAAEWPWATPANLQRAIAAVAARMNTDEDVLFIHLTSHGARSGELATAFWPIQVEPLTPAALKAALDVAGVKHRVISVSACYSGSWIAPLADEHTLVMTAADANNTSFGCGVGSELTYYGRAVFDEALRRDTRSFEAALASAREVIRQRELDAGKDDGYSNPQIHVGSAIRARLKLLEGAQP